MSMTLVEIRKAAGNDSDLFRYLQMQDAQKQRDKGRKRVRAGAVLGLGGVGTQSAFSHRNMSNPNSTMGHYGRKAVRTFGDQWSSMPPAKSNFARSARGVGTGMVMGGGYLAYSGLKRKKKANRELRRLAEIDQRVAGMR